MMAQGDASNIASNTFGEREKQSLLAMKALIDRHLDEMEQAKEEAEVSKREDGEDVKDVEMEL
jgi:hypothetical protein